MANPPFKFTGSSTLSPVCNKKRKDVFVTPFYDEQLQFKTADQVVLQNMHYFLSLADGSIVTGVTDSGGDEAHSHACARGDQDGQSAGGGRQGFRWLTTGPWPTAKSADSPTRLSRW